MRAQKLVIGMDEVGRGCWAGPVVVGAVLLGEPIPGLKDSKLLSRLRRQELDLAIRNQALGLGLGWADAREIDEVGITGALKLAYARALAGISIAADEIVIDGAYNFIPEDKRVRTLIDADALEPSVSAASIIAKVARDNYMTVASQEYPGYGFEQHVGYGTKMHQEALTKQGICVLHRTSFRPIRKLVANRTRI